MSSVTQFLPCRIRKGASILAIAIVSSLVLAPGAVAARQRPATPTWKPLVGHVSAHTPVRGAKVVLYDLRGRVIARAARRTDVNGAFYLRMKRVPANFVVRTSGGRDDAGVVRGTLESRVLRHRLYRPVVVNTATTLGAVYAKAHPHMAHATAERRVARYLGLPVSMDLRIDLLVNDTEFHGGAFMRQAKRNPQAFARRLVRDIDAGKRFHYTSSPADAATRTRASRAAKVGGTPVTNAQFIQATSALVSFATKTAPAGAVFGAVLGVLLGSDPDPSTARFDLIDSKLDDLQSSLNFSLSRQYVAQVNADFNAYAASVQSFAHLEARMHEAWVAYSIAVRASAAPVEPSWMPGKPMPPASPHPTPAEAETARANFAGYYADEMLTDGLSLLATQLTASGAAGSSPLLLWKRALDDRDRFVSFTSQADYAAAYEYWRVLHARLLVMNLEYASMPAGARYAGRISQWINMYARTGTDGTVDSREMSNWMTQAGLDTITRPLEEGEMYDAGTGSYWTAGNQGTRWSHITGKWRVPTSAEAETIFTRQGGRYGLGERGFATGQAYLAANYWSGSVTACSYIYTDDGYISAEANLVDVASGRAGTYVSFGDLAERSNAGQVCYLGIWTPGAGLRPTPR